MKPMNEIVPQSLADIIMNNKLVAVLVIEKKETIRPLIHTLYEAGVRIVELTLRTPIAIEAIEIIAKEFSQITLGAGTVLTVEQLREVRDRGADFAVAPGLNEHILEEAIHLHFPFFPGVMTPSEIEKAITYGCKILKFFPSESLGGLDYLTTTNAPYAHLGLSYIPLGGINTSNLAKYITSPIVGAVGGSWLAPLNLVNEEHWSQITKNIKEAITIIKSAVKRSIK